MKGIIPAILLSLLLCAHAQTLIWSPPPDYTPQGYVVFHGTQSGAYSDCWSAGTSTNFNLSVPLATGANYFVVTSWKVDEASNLLMSSWSNEAVVTNMPGWVLSTIILTATNLGSCWLSLQTNHMIIFSSKPAAFFTASNSLIATNIILIPK